MIYKPTSAFRLSKEAKRVMARYTDPHKAGLYKRNMIESQLYAEEADKKPVKMAQSKQDE